MGTDEFFCKLLQFLQHTILLLSNFPLWKKWNYQFQPSTPNWAAPRFRSLAATVVIKKKIIAVEKRNQTDRLFLVESLFKSSRLSFRVCAWKIHTHTHTHTHTYICIHTHTHTHIYIYLCIYIIYIRLYVDTNIPTYIYLGFHPNIWNLSGKKGILIFMLMFYQHYNKTESFYLWSLCF